MKVVNQMMTVTARFSRQIKVINNGELNHCCIIWRYFF